MAKRKKMTVPRGAFEKAFFHWKAPEFLRYNRSWGWFLVLGLVDALLIAYGVLSESWTMTLVFIVLPLVYLLEHRKKPEVWEVKVSEYGIQFGEITMAYSQLKAFWILHNPPYVDEIRFKTSSRVHPEITIPLMGIDPSLLRQYLVTQVRELEGKKPSLLDTLVRVFRLA